MTNHTYLGGDSSLPMSVDNISFLLDRLGEDCAPLQFLRELTQNSIEAIERVGGEGEITWDVDWVLYDLGDLMKLSITDSGDGMTGSEMLKFINQLSSSGSEQSFTANYGIGAKIAAATQNPVGVQYQSWKNGEGALIHLEKARGQYGLRQFELSNGQYQHWLPLEDDVKPECIENHGTKVVLYGKSDNQNTMEAPEDTASPSRWISKYLNTRYFKIPDGITIRAREGWDFPRDDKDRNYLRKIIGQKAYLDEHSVKSGVQSLASVNVHWWILKDEKAITNNSGYIESAGHVGALYQNEIYDRATARAGTAMLQNFGILFGGRFVVLYVEPLVSESVSLTTNTARTTLLLNGNSLPWADWAHEFRDNMPEELIEFVQEKAEGVADNDHQKSIKDKLKPIMELYKVSRYKPTPQGFYLSDPSTKVPTGPSPNSGAKSAGGGGSAGKNAGFDSSGQQDGKVGDIYHLFEKKDGIQSNKIETDPFPIVKWVSIESGTREPGDMEDRAAKYIGDQNTLLVNGDFRVFKDVIKRLCAEKGGTINVEPVVTDVVHQWFELALVEAVIGIQQLKGSKEWGPKEIESALSEEALTTSVMLRYHVHNSCRRELGAKLGKSKAGGSAN